MNISRKEILIGFSVLVVFVVLGSAAGFVVARAQKPVSPQQLLSCLSKDAFGGAQVNPICVTNTVKTLLKTYTTADVMGYLAASTTPEDLTSVCHAIGHVVGQQTFENVGSVEGALSECTSACAFGCIHGVIGAAVVQQLGNDNEDIEHASEATITAIGSKYCAKGGALCHAMGHLLYMNGSDLPKALAGCETVAVSANTKEACYQGAFMEDAGEQSPSGPGTPLFLMTTTTSMPASQNYSYPCSGLAVSFQHACFMNLFYFQANLFHLERIPTGTTQLTIEEQTCESFSGEARADCFEGIGYTLYLTFSGDSYVDACPLLPLVSDRAACALGVITAASSHYVDAANYCEGISEQSIRNICLDAIFETIGVRDAAQVSLSVCNGSSAPDICESAGAAYIAASSTLPDYFLGLTGGHQ